MAEFVILETNNFFTRFLLVAGIFVVALLVIEAVSGCPTPLNRFGFGIIYLFFCRGFDRLAVGVLVGGSRRCRYGRNRLAGGDSNFHGSSRLWGTATCC